MEATGAEKGMFSEAEYNPVGSYIKYFDLDKSMCGKRIHICFEGVEEAMYLWLNSQFVGYAEDSFTPSELDVYKRQASFCASVSVPESYIRRKIGSASAKSFSSPVFNNSFAYMLSLIHI